MPVPNHPEKYDSEPLVTPEMSTEQMQAAEGEPDLPTAVILTYSRNLMSHLTETYEGTLIDRYFGDLYLFEDAKNDIGVLGNFGIGAPTTAMLMEELIADGVETFLSIGYAGSLDPDIQMGEIIVCEKAIRDEGTSHHYRESTPYAYPTESMTDTLYDLLQERGSPVHLGSSWTTDAVFQETRAEVERYADEGILTVEMEAATVFTVAEYRDVEAASMFVVSDYLGVSEWEPKFHEAGSDLEALGETSKGLLQDYL